MTVEIPGQLNAEERRILTDSILKASKKPEVVLEVGTWLGGGSTLHFLRALEANNCGHLWGIEADRSIYERMIDNLRNAAPEALHRFTPLFGLSSKIIPQWLETLSPESDVDVAFLDGGDNPAEQIHEFKSLAQRIAVGGRLLAHDAKLRKGKWLKPYLFLLDNWEIRLHDISTEGLLEAVKIGPRPSPGSRRRAEAKLLILRLQPVELIGSMLPKQVCAFILGLIPSRLARRLSQGRS